MRWTPTVVSLACLAAVGWWAAHQDAPRLPSTTGAAGALVAALGVYALVTVMRAERWHALLHQSDISLGRADSYGLTTVGYMGNNVMPARAGELLRMWLVATRTGAGKRQVFGTLIAERMLDALAVIVLFTTVAFTDIAGVDLELRHVALLAGAAILAAALGLGLLRLLSGTPRAARLLAFARPLWTASLQLRSLRGVALLAFSVAIWAAEAAVYWAVAPAVDVELGFAGAVYVTAFTNLFGLIPAGPGYVGTFDSAVVMAMKATGARGAGVVSYLLLLRFVLFVPITVVGLVVLFARYGGLARYREARLAQATAA